MASGDAVTLTELDHEERMRLLHVICYFAWADDEIQLAERGFIDELVQCLKLEEEDRLLVRRWLEDPRAAKAVDPAAIPRVHRELFLRAARAILMADGRFDETESEAFRRFEARLRD